MPFRRAWRHSRRHLRRSPDHDRKGEHPHRHRIHGSHLLRQRHSHLKATSPRPTRSNTRRRPNSWRRPPSCSFRRVRRNWRHQTSSPAAGEPGCLWASGAYGVAAELGEGWPRSEVSAGGLGPAGRVLATDIDQSSRARGVLEVLRYEVRTTYSGTTYSGTRHSATRHSGSTYSGSTYCAARRLAEPFDLVHARLDLVRDQPRSRVCGPR